jgi:hypothetical protein
MKTFYTVRDIEDMHAAGVTQIETHDDVVVTDVAREKAIALGMRLVPVEAGSARPTGPRTPGAGSAAALSPTAAPAPPDDLVRRVKAAVAARLGTDKYNDLLDRLIPQVMSQLRK